VYYVQLTVSQSLNRQYFYTMCSRTIVDSSQILCRPIHNIGCQWNCCIRYFSALLFYLWLFCSSFTQNFFFLFLGKRSTSIFEVQNALYRPPYYFLFFKFQCLLVFSNFDFLLYKNIFVLKLYTIQYNIFYFSKISDTSRLITVCAKNGGQRSW